MGVNSSEVVSLDVRCDAEAPALVRAALAEREQLGWIIGDATLVASELVTNTVVHSRGSADHVLHVTVTVDADRLRICVENPGVLSGTASPLQMSEFADLGVGLLIVDELVERWGAERDGGYRVWAELARTGP